MRTHTTKTLKELVVEKLDKDKHQMSEHECAIWLQSLPEIEREMMDVMEFFNCHLFDKQMRNRQYQQIHKECIYLLDKIDKLDALPAEMSPLISALTGCLDHIVDKLFANYRKYLDMEIFMPVLHLRKAQIRIAERKEVLQTVFNHFGVDKKLQQVILVCMTDVGKATRCPYERLQYVSDLQEALTELCKSEHKSTIRKGILEFLVGRNYNTEAFINYYKKAVLDDLAELPEVSDQLDFLQKLVWDLQIHPYRKSVFCYDHSRKRAKDVLHGFVEGELSMRQAKARANQQVAREAVRVTQAQTDPLPMAYKIRTPMTVDMLAYFIKLMVNAKVIEPGVKMELMTFAAGIFHTPGTGVNGIAPGSLYTKYRQVVQSSAKSVRVLLARMLKDIDEEFGDG